MILPSEFFGARSKEALRSEAYAWAPVLRSFDKLSEVGVEALNGRLIGPKSWNRSVGIYETHLQSVSVLGAVLGVGVIICETNCIVMCMRPEMAMKFGFTKWNRCW